MYIYLHSNCGQWILLAKICNLTLTHGRVGKRLQYKSCYHLFWLDNPHMYNQSNVFSCSVLFFGINLSLSLWTPVRATLQEVNMAKKKKTLWKPVGGGSHFQPKKASKKKLWLSMTEKNNNNRKERRHVGRPWKRLSWQIWNILVMCLASFIYCCLVVSARDSFLTKNLNKGP